MSFIHPTIAPSGIFLPTIAVTPQPISSTNLPIYNPSVLDRISNNYENSEIELVSSNFAAQCTTMPKVSQRDLDQYADTIINLVSALNSEHADCSLAPLRGAAKPCIYAEIMSGGKVQFEYFDFHGASSGYRDSEIVELLTAILLRSRPVNSLFTIRVLDTAIGGHGITKLIELLKSVHIGKEFKHQHWLVIVHIIHPVNEHVDIGRIQAIKALADLDNTISLHRYPVSDLLVEDYEEAIGFSWSQMGSSFVAKPSIWPGRFIFKTDTDTRIITTHYLALTFDRLYCSAITEAMTTHPEIKQAGDVWAEYQNKG